MCVMVARVTPFKLGNWWVNSVIDREPGWVRVKKVTKTRDSSKRADDDLMKCFELL